MLGKHEQPSSCLYFMCVVQFQSNGIIIIWKSINLICIWILWENERIRVNSRTHHWNWILLEITFDGVTHKSRTLNMKLKVDCFRIKWPLDGHDKIHLNCIKRLYDKQINMQMTLFTIVRSMDTHSSCALYSVDKIRLLFTPNGVWNWF